ncbi:hypothetical protein L6452_17511 [Arctium lappa]|uniref:Uncharacterized protein n=1 Tax=Arctium lappa TaxID=4217 RepID=A0ACB9C3G6_ARCLA|nr:hypothetical protein L6452_17511 [Arctium lappa]
MKWVVIAWGTFQDCKHVLHLTFVVPHSFKGISLFQGLLICPIHEYHTKPYPIFLLPFSLHRLIFFNFCRILQFRV